MLLHNFHSLELLLTFFISENIIEIYPFIYSLTSSTRLHDQGQQKLCLTIEVFQVLRVCQAHIE